MFVKPSEDLLMGLAWNSKRSPWATVAACWVRMPSQVPQPSARGATCSVALWSWRRLQLPGHLVASLKIMMASFIRKGPKNIFKKDFYHCNLFSSPKQERMINEMSVDKLALHQRYQQCVSWSRGLWLVPLSALLTSVSGHLSLVSTRGAERGYLEDTH